jgi:hypothetical protein
MLYTFVNCLLNVAACIAREWADVEHGGTVPVGAGWFVGTPTVADVLAHAESTSSATFHPHLDPVHGDWTF